MGLHLLLLAKLKLLVTSHCPGPVVAAFLWPFALKISFSGCISRACTLSISSVLIVFQLSQILFHEQSVRHGHRWERAFRVVCERADVTRRWFSTVQSHDASLNAVSMLALQVPCACAHNTLSNYGLRPNFCLAYSCFLFSAFVSYI